MRDTTHGEIEHRSDGLVGFSPEVIGELRRENASLGAGGKKVELVEKKQKKESDT